MTPAYTGIAFSWPRVTEPAHTPCAACLHHVVYPALATPMYELEPWHHVRVHMFISVITMNKHVRTFGSSCQICGQCCCSRPTWLKQTETQALDVSCWGGVAQKFLCKSSTGLSERCMHADGCCAEGAGTQAEPCSESQGYQSREGGWRR